MINWPVPRSTKYGRAFVGVRIHYRILIIWFSVIAALSIFEGDGVLHEEFGHREREAICDHISRRYQWKGIIYSDKVAKFVETCEGSETSS